MTNDFTCECQEAREVLAAMYHWVIRDDNPLSRAAYNSALRAALWTPWDRAVIAASAT